MNPFQRTFVSSLIALSISSCVSDKKDVPVISDASLYDLIREPAAFQFFKRSADTLATDPQSPHTSFVRVLFNIQAQNAMDSSLSDLSGGSFPEGSMVVKEIYDSPGGPLKAYAVMYKSTASAHSGAGWLWNEMDAAGNVLYSVSKSGGDCTGCHSAPGNRDFVRTIELH